MTPAARRHLCVLLPSPVAHPVEKLRRQWDPVMAARAPAHVTVTYPEETGDDELLLSRAEDVCADMTCFRLRLTGVFSEDGGRGGVFLSVEDVDGGWARLRRHLLAPPFRPVDFPPHVTVAHPRTAPDGPACRAALTGRRLDRDPGESGFDVAELCHTETTTASFTVLRRFPLGGAPQRRA
ncbi:2'-5' RNA ligase family protein [Actinopolymorpha sp. NPDC004070]|uniref:2'-5' RNA ligase family protein n=1 Tax=Actinopolymorpha sp. NPDC004070 TaxID=3154548 RepID=UPI0033B2D157